MNEIYDTLLKTLTDIYDTNFPIPEYILKDKDTKFPWITKGLNKYLKKKQKLQIKFLKAKHLKMNLSLFEKLRKKAKITNYSKLLHKYKTDSKRTCQRNNWKKKRKSNLLPREIKVYETIIQNPQDIAKEFNKIFTSIGSK